jgi:hypothetical protein
VQIAPEGNERVEMVSEVRAKESDIRGDVQSRTNDWLNSTALALENGNILLALHSLGREFVVLENYYIQRTRMRPFLIRMQLREV